MGIKVKKDKTMARPMKVVDVETIKKLAQMHATFD